MKTEVTGLEGALKQLEEQLKAANSQLLQKDKDVLKAQQEADEAKASASNINLILKKKQAEDSELKEQHQDLLNQLKFTET